MDRNMEDVCQHQEVCSHKLLFIAHTFSIGFAWFCLLLHLCYYIKFEFIKSNEAWTTQIASCCYAISGVLRSDCERLYTMLNGMCTTIVRMAEFQGLCFSVTIGTCRLQCPAGSKTLVDKWPT